MASEITPPNMLWWLTKVSCKSATLDQVVELAEQAIIELKKGKPIADVKFMVVAMRNELAAKLQGGEDVSW